MNRLAAAALLLAALAANAGALSGVTPVAAQYSDTTTWRGISITSGTTAMEVLQLGTIDYGIRGLVIQNHDYAGNIKCSDNVNLSSNTFGGVLDGFTIYYGSSQPNTWQFTLAPTVQNKFYCTCTNPAATCNAAMGRFR